MLTIYMSLPLNRILIALLLSILLGTAIPALAENWPTWRGPTYNGVTSEKGLPVEWGETDEDPAKNIVWTCDLPEYGWSTPIVWGDAIFLTAQKEDRLLLLKINKQNGRIEWTRTVGHGQAKASKPVTKKGDARRRQRFHQEHNMASPSCATDGQHIVVHFGNGDLAVYDFEGNRLWKLNLQEKYGPFTVWWGHANSPILHGDLVVALAIQDSCADLSGEPSESYLVAFDLKTGKERWRTRRKTDAKKEHCDSYVTPVLRKLADHTELVILGGECLDAYDLETGRRTWFLPQFEGNRNVTGPIVEPIFGDFFKGTCRPNDRGDPFRAGKVDVLPIGHRRRPIGAARETFFPEDFPVGHVEAVGDPFIVDIEKESLDHHRPRRVGRPFFVRPEDLFFRLPARPFEF